MVTWIGWLRPSAAAFAAFLVVVVARGPAARGQDECQIPWFVLQNTVGANVMMLCDTSSSMN